ncbi:serine hydrolase domain-containing protein [Jannaschia sp. CCS1]|uniref:serine hydrolase domain-containing protein n=1 Tax=Jannaschia sp. (strain CCS1) TaxID=290400 RepID=UPI000053B1EC|nr:serine hydrolase domain-containing protein [Jannaschia sp. CCS1]ABD55966.1 beta-lactamase [Jannaschia sp. CCS1]
MKQFEELVRRATETGGYLAAGVSRLHTGEPAQTMLRGRLHPSDPAGDLDPELRMRCASITKAATARLACELAVLGQIDLASPIARLLPDVDDAITFDMLLSHTSGLRDTDGYLTPAGVSPTQLAHPPATTPGTFFHYANLNYVLLGAGLEAATQARFDHLLNDHVLRPAKIDGGLNWAGVADRRPLPLFQRIDGALSLVVDGPDADWSADLIWAEGRGFELETYQLVRDTCLMSPHAGLRLSLPEMARLARHLGADSEAAILQRDVLWRYNGRNGDGCNGLFPAFGRGVTIFESHAQIPGPLIGHAGHALGFSGGAWWNPQTGVAHAYALTGAADETLANGDEPFFPETELHLLRLF